MKDISNMYLIAIVKKVIKNEARNIYKEIKRKSEREITIEQLKIKDIDKISIFPEYYFEESCIRCKECILYIAR